MNKKNRTIDLGPGTIYFGNTKANFCMGYRDTAYEVRNCCEIIIKNVSRINTAKFRIIYQQIGYSIELLLKALILWNDYSDETKKYIRKTQNGHNLEKLFDKLIQEHKVILDENEKKYLSELNSYYSSANNFRYLMHIDKNNCDYNFMLVAPSYYFRIIDKLYGKAKQTIFI